MANSIAVNYFYHIQRACRRVVFITQVTVSRQQEDFNLWLFWEGLGFSRAVLFEC
jgi:hypothetical protein